MIHFATRLKQLKKFSHEVDVSIQCLSDEIHDAYGMGDIVGMKRKLRMWETVSAALTLCEKRINKALDKYKKGKTKEAESHPMK